MKLRSDMDPILTTLNIIDLRQKLIIFWVKKKKNLNRIQAQLLQKRQTTKPNQISSAPLFTLIHFSFFLSRPFPKIKSLSPSLQSQTRSLSLSLVKP